MGRFWRAPRRACLFAPQLWPARGWHGVRRNLGTMWKRRKGTPGSGHSSHFPYSTASNSRWCCQAAERQLSCPLGASPPPHWPSGHRGRRHSRRQPLGAERVSPSAPDGSEEAPLLPSPAPNQIWSPRNRSWSFPASPRPPPRLPPRPRQDYSRSHGPGCEGGSPPASAMATAGSPLQGCDILIVHSPDAQEWCQYLESLFFSNWQVRHQHTLTYELKHGAAISTKDLALFFNSRCIIILLSVELVQNFYEPNVLSSLQKALCPPYKVLKLFCGVQDSEDFSNFFKDWASWQELTYEDEPETYVAAVKKAFSEDSGCDSITDTEAEDEKVPLPSENISFSQKNNSLEATPENLMVVQPDRIRCGVNTTVYVIVKCKLDNQVKTEAEFSPNNSPAVRVLAKLENEYTLSVKAPNLSSGDVYLKVYSGDLMVCEATVCYYTDMEEIENLLASAANPVEFMCQAFKIVPYNIETLDKLLTESLKKNIPASGLHLFGINQLEEEDMMITQRDEELPTLLHFAAKYGLKNLTALLLTCPGALQAYSVANKHGHYPNTIAEKYGYKDLRQFIDEYVETVDMLKSHIKEELMQGEEDKSVYESMAHLSTDLLMKCSLNPGCDEELYESMATLSTASTEDLYVEMLQSSTSTPKSTDPFPTATKDSIIRKFLEGNSIGDAPFEKDLSPSAGGEEVYHTVDDDLTFAMDMAKRPPVPVPRPDTSLHVNYQMSQSESYISKVFTDKSQERPGNLYISNEHIRKETLVRPRKDRPQSSIYDPFAGMKTPGQRQLITLQEQVKLGIVNVDEAVLHFKEWQLNQKKRSESFRFQQENLKRLRDSITRRQQEKQKSGKQSDLEITVPIRHNQQLPGKVEYGIYESGPRKSIVPPKNIIRRGDWKTESASSTSSSNSNRSSTRSVLSVSSGMEGDNEDNEFPEVIRSRSPGPQPMEKPPIKPMERPPRIPPRAASQRPPSRENFHPPPPVPPRGR
ncbi:phosphoinositide 3-kinase adapter protein 1 isoform X1 [Antechinus flavipes]|uniref:phosphoinositide 3-kinase adapter protein 1 isoform X1 n=1 Tax=Antechinus flavipes TaxID=38775 RepID=UPI0022358335|nr:phosphoinositide 3-kinase adapter protein 1 isoform X1 [Antechinus flavipes]